MIKNPIIRGVADYSVYLVVRSAMCLVQALPIDVSMYLGKSLAYLCSNILGFRRKLVYDNISRSFPDWSEEQVKDTMLASWEHLFMLGIEVALTPRKIHQTNWRKHLDLVNVEQILAHFYEEDRPIVFVTGHFGNFEVGGYLLGLLGHPTYAVARTLDNPYLDRFIKDFREKTGQFLIAKKGAAEDIVAAMDRRDIVTFLADQADSGGKGLWVDFFGRPASTYKAIAVVALQYRATICFCYVARKDGGKPLEFELRVSELLDLRQALPEAENAKTLTQWHVNQLEMAIREHTTQYWWVHDRWKSCPAREKKEFLQKAQRHEERI